MGWYGTVVDSTHGLVGYMVIVVGGGGHDHYEAGECALLLCVPCPGLVLTAAPT